MKLINQVWSCDKCGEPIVGKEGGMLQWHSATALEKDAEGFQIVHNTNKCLYNQKDIMASKKSTVSDLPLDHINNTDGFITLLSFLSDDRVKDIEEILQIIKRLFVPKYESTFRSFDEAIANEVFEPNTKKNYYNSKDLAAVYKYLKNNPL